MRATAGDARSAVVQLQAQVQQRKIAPCTVSSVYLLAYPMFLP